jgi:hypothetical protein
MITTFTLRGGVELQRLLDTMPKNIQKAAIRKIVKNVINVPYEAVIRRIQALPSSGLLKRSSLKLRMLMSFRKHPAKKQRAGVYSMDAAFVDAERFGLIYYAQGAHTPISFNVRNRHGNLVDKRHGERGRTFVPAALEWGHGSNKEAAARPFMRPAIDSSEAEAERRMAAELKDELDRIVREAGGSAA